MRRLLHIAVLAPFALALACDYEAPPEPSLVKPQGGAYRSGDPIQLAFSLPIEPETLRLRIWPNNRDIEGELLPDTEPLLTECTLATSPCGSTELSISENGRSATLVLNPLGLGQPDVPLVLEIFSGLKSSSTGTSTGTNYLFDFQFKPRIDREPSTEPVDFDSGYYLLVADITDPAPALLNLYIHMIALEDGRMVWAGNEYDEIGDAPKNTLNPEEVQVDKTDQGWAVFGTGFVASSNGERFMDTDPLEVILRIGPIEIVLSAVRMIGKIEADPETGLDRIEGTLAYEGVILRTGDSDGFGYPAGDTSFEMVYVPPELVTDGVPELCTNPCGATITQCEPPDGFPGDAFCP